MTTLTIKKAFNQALEKHGFKNKSGSWYQNCKETVLVANLQKLEYCDRYFVNLAVWFKALGEADFPKENHCHLRIRLSRLAGLHIDAVLDATNDSFTDESRSTQIIECMERVGIPFLQSCSTVSSAAEQFSSGRLSHGFVHKHLRDIFTNLK